jgi:DNA-binding CsgD family transcriptional regulator
MKKHGPGRPAYEPTERDRQTVKLMVAAGIERLDIAACLGIDPKTLRKYFKSEMRTAAQRANAQVAGSLFNKATSADHPQAVTAAIWWTKTRMGWKETVKNEHTGEDGEPILAVVTRVRRG